MNLVAIVNYRNTGNLYARIRVPRSRYKFTSLKTRDRTEAEQRVKEWRLEAIARAAYADAQTADVWTRILTGKDHKVCDAIETFLGHLHLKGVAHSTSVDTANLLDQFARFHDIAQLPLAAVTAEHVSQWVNAPDGTSLATREHRLSRIKSWLNYCRDAHYIVKNPALDLAVRLEGLTSEQVVSKPFLPLTDGDVKAILAAIPPSDYWHGATLFGYHYGLSLSTVATLEESNVTGNLLRVYRRKGRRIVNERLNDEVIAWLDIWRQHRPASDMPYLFPSQAADALGGRLNRLSEQFTQRLRDIGITGKSFHGLRKTATQRRWDRELAELGPKEKRALTAMVAQHGYAKVQQMLAHAPGSEVTAKHYFTAVGSSG